MFVGLGAVLPATTAPLAGLPVADMPRLPVPTPGRAVLVKHAGTAPVTIDTTRLTGPALRGLWVDGMGGRTVDAGSVQRGAAVRLYPPDTGDTTPHDWTLVVLDATRGLLPPA